MEVTHSSPGKEGLLSLLAALPSLTAGSSRSLHNVTYVTYVPPDCPIPPGAGEAPRTAPPRPAAALTGGENPAESRLGFSHRAFGKGRPRPRRCASVRVPVPSAGRRRRRQPSPASLPAPGSRTPGLGSAGELLLLLPFLTALLTGSFLSAPCASPLPFPRHSSPTNRGKLALPFSHLDIRTQGLRGQNQSLTAILNLCCTKINWGEVIPWLIAVV